MSNGELSKLEIKAFKDKRLTDPVDPPSFIVPINPESFSRSLAIEQDEKKGQGNQGTDVKYSNTKVEEIKLDFTLDGTNTMMGYHKSHDNKSVPEQLEDFLSVAYYINGNTHRPNYLKLIWGTHYTFDCTLTKVDINYTLFHPDGTPLRAKVSATFKETCEQEKRVREEAKSSPDLTHIRQLKAGQTLLELVYDIYSDTSLYLQVARANNLTSFRNVSVGSEIVLPPLEKSSN